MLERAQIIQTLVTILFFSVEAYFQFSIGKGAFVVPSAKEAGLVLLTVIVVTTASLLASRAIVHLLDKKNRNTTAGSQSTGST